MVLKLFNDRSYTVIASALVTFHQICIARRPANESEESSLAMLHPYFRRILQVLPGLDSFGQGYGIDLMLRYGKMFFRRTKGIRWLIRACQVVLHS